MRSDDINLKGILVFLGILAFTVGAAYGAVALMTARFEVNAQKSDQQTARLGVASELASSQPYFPGPREQPAPRADLDALRAREEVELQSYGWIDRSNGVVRIPIERAMELIVQQKEGHP